MAKKIEIIMEITMLILMSTLKIAKMIMERVGTTKKKLKLKMLAIDLRLSEFISASIPKLKT